MIKLSADIIIEYPDGEIVLVKRKNEPFKNMWAIPGGMVDEGETAEEAAIREAKEETGLDVQLVRLVGVFSKPGRDPRGQYVSVAYHAVPVGGTLKAGDDAIEHVKTAGYLSYELGFDHTDILKRYKATKIE